MLLKHLRRDTPLPSVPQSLTFGCVFVPGVVRELFKRVVLRLSAVSASTGVVSFAWIRGTAARA